MQYYGPNFSLDVRASNTENTNSPEYLERMLLRVAQNLKEVAFAPSVQMQEVPRCSISVNSDDSQQDELDDEEEDQTPDSRNSQRSSDRRIKNSLELDDSDDEEPEQVLGKRKRSMDFSTSRKMGIMAK
jgi:histone deacetylase 1/2